MMSTQLTRIQLYERVWSTPVRTLAREFGLSDVGLKKICRRNDIPTPGLGYWAKLANGKKVTKPDLPIGKFRADQRILITGDHQSRSVASEISRSVQLPEARITANIDQPLRHALSVKTEQTLWKMKGDEWIEPPHGSLHVRVSPPLRQRALAIMDALLLACEDRGWQVAAEMPAPRRRHPLGNIWYPHQGWMSDLPKDRPAETGVIIRGEYVAFSIVEEGKLSEPTDAEKRAWRRQWPYGVGGPPMRKKPSGSLILEIAPHPWVSTRRNFRDSSTRPVEDQLNAAVVAFGRMASGLRAYSLKMALDRRDQKRAERRRAERERVRRQFERNLAILNAGMEKWTWSKSATAFLAELKVAVAERGGDETCVEWIQWAEQYVSQEPFHDLFSKLAMRGDGGAGHDG